MCAVGPLCFHTLAPIQPGDLNMNTIRRFLSHTPMLLALLAVLSLSACGGGGSASSENDNSNNATAVGDNTSNTGTTPTNPVVVAPPLPTNWSAQAYVKAANAGESDRFGGAVAIDGETLVVGASGEDSAQTTVTNGIAASPDNSAGTAGAVYVYVRSGNAWVQQAYLKAPNAQSFDQFGTSVAVSGDTLVVGAIGEDSGQTVITNGNIASADNSVTNAGAAYVFVRNTANGTWAQQAYLKAPNAEVNDAFGKSVAISNDTLVVGANGEDSNQTSISNGSSASADNSAIRAGAAYVFVRSDGNWSQQAYLKASNANPGDEFGTSVAISGETIVVGTPGESSGQTTISNGSNGSSASADNSAIRAGAAYVFARSGSTWTQQAYLKAPNAQEDDQFGFAVSISGGSVVVGAFQEGSSQTTITNGSGASADNSARSSGSAYVFTRSGSSWSQQAYLKAPNAEDSDQFGDSVAISGDTLVVGAPLENSNQTTVSNGSTASPDNSASNAGAAYVFVRSGSTWQQQAYLKAPNAEVGDEFGQHVAVSGNTIAVGAPRENSNQNTITNGSTASADNTASGAGAAYVFFRN